MRCNTGMLLLLSLMVMILRMNLWMRLTLGRVMLLLLLIHWMNLLMPPSSHLLRQSLPLPLLLLQLLLLRLLGLALLLQHITQVRQILPRAWISLKDPLNHLPLLPMHIMSLRQQERNRRRRNQRPQDLTGDGFPLPLSLVRVRGD